MTRLIVDVAFGYSVTSASPVWTDVSRFVDAIEAGVTIDRGAEDEQSETQEGTCSLTFDNSDGRFTSGRSASPYSPNVKKNVPLRVAVATLDSPSGSAPYALEQLTDDFDDDIVDTAKWVGNFGTVSETGGLARISAIAGVPSGFESARQWRLWGTNATARLVTVPGGGGNGRTSFMVNAITSGIRVGFEYNATTGLLSCKEDVGFFDGSPVNLTYSPSVHAWLRIREAGGTLFWETSSDGHTWTVRRSGATPVWVGVDQVTLQMAATRDSGTTDFAEYDLVGARVHPRFWGMVNEWPTEWEGLESKATVVCTDIFKWTSLNEELLPMLVQEVLLDRPTAYFPLSEPEESVSAGDLSGTPGVGSLSIVQAGSGGTLTFAAGAGPSDGLGAPVFTPASTSAGKYLSADLGQAMVDANLSFRVRAEAWFTTSTNGRVLLSLVSTDLATKFLILLESGTGKLTVEKDQNAQGIQTYVFATPNLADGALHHVVYNEFENLLYVDGVSYSLTAFNGTDLRILTVGGYAGTRLWSGTISHVAIYCRSVTAAELAGHYATGTSEHVGESAAARLSRIASYVGLTVTTQGTAFDPMASQKALGKSALAHMREIETTESGKLLASRSGNSLLFQSRSVRYNATSVASLAYSDLETNGVKFADDDQKIINTIVATRHGGATQRVINQASVDTYGTYKKDLELFKASDNSVLDAANWTVSRYADPPSEIRQIPLEASTLPLATYRALLDADVSTFFDVMSLPSQAAVSTATVCIEGYAEVIKQGTHYINFHTSRADTDSVWVLDDPVYSVLGSTTRLAY